jgi:hypothetical protein
MQSVTKSFIKKILPTSKREHIYKDDSKRKQIYKNDSKRKQIYKDEKGVDTKPLRVSLVDGENVSEKPRV